MGNAEQHCGKDDCLLFGLLVVHDQVLYRLEFPDDFSLCRRQLMYLLDESGGTGIEELIERSHISWR